MKKRLYMVHAQARYGTNTYIPLTSGCLWAYARTFPEITDAYEMVDFLYLKESIDKTVAKLDAPDIVALSVYIWNADWNKQFAHAVKERWPKCTILVGGVQIQDENPVALKECPDFDFAIYGEGEGAFADFLRAHHNGLYVTVGSLIWRDADGAIAVNPRRAFTDLAELRSPYLDGVFDELWKREPRWQILQETSRGCPYACTFCAWGQAALTDLRLFPEERVLAEFEWFGQRGADYLDDCDANFGIVKRDVALARALVATKEKYGYPKKFRAAFAKNSNETIWEIANVLHGAGMLKAVTLAMQSMDDGVLVNIKRKNIKVNKFGDLIQRYAEAGIPTYTELIMGLPGETLDSYLSGIEKNLDAGMHSGIFMYYNLVLNNTEQNTPEYVAAHGIKSLTLPAMLTHGTPDSSVIREKQTIVVETSVMPHEEWKHAWLFSKLIEVFHAQGLLQRTAISCHEHGMRYVDFYEGLYEWLIENPNTVAAREVANLEALLNDALAGGSWDCVDPRFGSISWPPEEFAFARIGCEMERFYDELTPFFETLPDGAAMLVAQRGELVRPVPGKEEEWAREVVWYNRKGTGTKKRAVQ